MRKLEMVVVLFPQ